MRLLVVISVTCAVKGLSATSCGTFEAAVCEEKGKSPLNPDITYARSFPKCCKPTKEEMTFREGLQCLKEDEVFRQSFARCLKNYFDESEQYNVLKPADAMAKIGPDIIQDVLKVKPVLKTLFERVKPLPGTDRTYEIPFDGDKWFDPGDALAGFGQQEFFRYAVGAAPHGGRGQGVQDGDDGDAPLNNPFHSYQMAGAKYDYPFITFWSGAANGFNDVLTIPTSSKKAANIGFFMRHHDVNTISEFFRVAGKLGTNLFDEGMHLKAMHTDGQDVPCLHLRLDMAQKEGVLWPAPKDVSAEQQDNMICSAFQSLLNAPWTLDQLNTEWSNDLKGNVPHLEARWSNFFAGFVKDKREDGPLTHLLSGSWDGQCGVESSLFPMPLSSLVMSLGALAIVVGVAVRCQRDTASGREPLLAT